MLEKSVVNAGGTHAWADTDALAIVSSKKGKSLRHIPGCKGLKALPWSTVKQITENSKILIRMIAVQDAGIRLLNLVDANY